MLNVSKDTIYNYEKGNMALPHGCIIQLCQEFNVSADYFFFGHDNAFKNKEMTGKELDSVLYQTIKKL